jgi:alpha,alpha-trehalose phosphorylase
VRKRELLLPPEHLYPCDEWRIVETRFSERYCSRAETVFALANGYLGLRGTFDEGRPVLSPGALVNGFHETWPIAYAEDAYGLARTGQTIVSVPDPTVLQLYVDDEPLYLPHARLTEYTRVLDMREGTLRRELVWSTPAGKHVRVRSCRLVSFEHRHLVGISYEVTVLDDSAPVTICSQIVDRQGAPASPGEPEPSRVDPRLPPSLSHRVLDLQLASADGTRLALGYRTAHSGMTLGVGVEHVIETAASHSTTSSAGEAGGELALTVDARPGIPIRITKYAAYQSSRSAPARELVERCERTLERAVENGCDVLEESQRAQLATFWSRADARVLTRDGSLRLQQAIRWNLFQVAQATWRTEGAGVPAKGLTGPGYEGHYFWDCEMYVLPMLSYTWPRIARNLLRFRHSMLPRARRRARDLSQRGALFPWRTINGEEASAAYQAGTAQYHINADIAYAVRRYLNVQGDTGFLAEVGGEILVETARLWEDLGFYDEQGNFHIHGVTGPDEYTTVVNDNAYTNLMARLNLNTAASAMRQLQGERPDDYEVLAEEVGLGSEEVEAWERAAAAMHIPYDAARGIHPQDDAFLDREVWDLESTPRENFPLLLHYHPLVIYRFQVIKQADIVLAMFLLGNEMSQKQKRRNFDYYDALTTGDSSLSACVQCILAAEIGSHRRALEYFTYALLMDLANVAGNTSDGVHVASAAGVWMALVYGFGGVRDFDGDLSFDPALPLSWASLAFSLRFRNRHLRITLTHDDERYELEEGEPLQVTIRAVPHVLACDAPVVLRQARGEEETRMISTLAPASRPPGPSASGPR